MYGQQCTVQLAIQNFTTHTTINLILPHLEGKIEYSQYIIHIQLTSFFVSQHKIAIAPAPAASSSSLQQRCSYSFTQKRRSNSSVITIIIYPHPHPLQLWLLLVFKTNPQIRELILQLLLYKTNPRIAPAPATACLRNESAKTNAATAIQNESSNRSSSN